jgi:hypothetical protein
MKRAKYFQVALIVFVAWCDAARAQVPYDPFQSVPAPVVRPQSDRPAAPRQRPVAPQAEQRLGRQAERGSQRPERSRQQDQPARSPRNFSEAAMPSLDALYAQIRQRPSEANALGTEAFRAAQVTDQAITAQQTRTALGPREVIVQFVLGASA